MGQILTHGIYLPDEGERNCYNGLASNWSILDGAVGTVAEHTSALAGKAPAVHTHTKSDVTDLFNSANTWTGDQTTTGTYYIKSTTWEKGVEPSSATHRNIYFTDKNNLTVGTIRRRIANGAQSFQFFGSSLVKNGQLDPTGDNVTWGFSQVFSSDGSTYFQFDGNIGNSIVPKSNNTYDLGSSSNKWKTLNGINPGALSLPSGGTTENTDWYNVAGDILPTGGNATDFTGGQNFFTPSKDGWLALTVISCESINVWISSLNYGLSVVAPDASLNRQLIVPVVAGKQVEIKVKGNRWFAAKLIMPQGNV